MTAEEIVCTRCKSNAERCLNRSRELALCIGEFPDAQRAECIALAAGIKSACIAAGHAGKDAEIADQRRFPVISGGTIPWAVAELAYISYAQRSGSSQSLERLAERGGFGVEELDVLLPDWRDRCVPRLTAHIEGERP